jgi:PAS domain S-box-containing protein
MMRSRFSILIVDDEASILKLLTTALGKDYRVFTAHSGEQALAILKKRRIEIILTDQSMPAMTGLAFLRAAHTIQTNTVNVLFTGYDDMAAAIDAINSRLVWRYLRKPFNLEELVMTVRQAAERCQLLEENHRLAKELIKANEELEKKVERRTRDLKQSREQFRTLVESALTGIAIIQDERLQYCNTRCRKILGYKKRDCLGREIFDFISAGDHDALKKRITAILSGRISLRPQVVRWVHSSGKIIVSEVLGARIQHHGRPAVQLNFIDMTPRHHALCALKESEQRFATLFQESLDALLIVDPANQKILQANRGVRRLLGYKKKELIGQSFALLFAEASNSASANFVHELLVHNAVFYEQKFISADGCVIAADLTATLLKWGETKAILVNIRDVSERNEMLQAIRRRDERYEMLVEHIPDGFYRSTPAGKFITVNRALVKMLGYDSTQELKNVNIPRDLYFSNDEREIAQSSFAQPDSETVVFRLKKKNGDEVWVEEKGHIGYDENGQVAYYEGMLRDVTDRKKAEDALRHSEELFRLISENAADLIAVIDHQGRYLYTNSSFKTLLGYSKDELRNQTIFDFIHPQEMASARRTFDEAVALKKGCVIETRVQHKNGEPRVLAVSCNVILNGAGSADRLVMVAHDVTERKQMEIEMQRAKEASEAANRAKSEFLANMSHEIRTPLNGILGYAELLMEEPLTPEQADFLATIHKSGNYLLNLINQILDISKIESHGIELELEPFVLNDIIREKIQFLQPRLSSKGVALNYHFEPGVPSKFCGDATRLAQVILNLLSNAAKFTDAGAISVVVRKGDFDPGDPQRFPLQITVSDTGIGIPADKHEFIFETFTQLDSSSTRKNHGTGLGLAITKKLVEIMGGTIAVDSQINEGSTFTINLPLTVCGEAADANFSDSNDQLGANGSGGAPAAETPPAAGYRAHILLAEDNEVNWRLIQKILARQGYEITVAQSGKAVLKALALQKFDLVLMDMQMPEMDGFETTQIIRKNPQLQRLPIIALTAYAMVGDAEKCKQAGCDDYLTKPINKNILIERVNFHLQKRITLAEPARPDFTDGQFQEEIADLKSFYITNLKERYCELVSALQNENFEEIGMIGHSLKGSGASYGFNDITVLGYELEVASHRRDLNASDRLIRSLADFLKKQTAARAPAASP